jgi:hypothetical protein
MSDIKLEAQDYDRYLSHSEKAAHEAAIISNDAFVAAMNKQIGRKREKAVAGTFVDLTPHPFARRFVGERGARPAARRPQCAWTRADRRSARRR